MKTFNVNKKSGLVLTLRKDMYVQIGENTKIYLKQIKGSQIRLLFQSTEKIDRFNFEENKLNENTSKI